MPSLSAPFSRLRETLHAALSHSPDLRQLNGLVEMCHSLAFTALCAKSGRGRLYHEGSRDLSDLAYDCIAELFQRDDAGHLIRLKTYFESFDIDRASDPELLAHLRRLVFSAVNQSLFRIYNDLDPALGRILRNIKLAVHSLQTCVEVDRFGEPCIAPALCDSLDHLPLMDMELLQSELARLTLGTEKIPEILAKLSLFLRRQSDYARLVPLITLARAVRGVYALKQIAPPAETEHDQAALHADVSAACLWASSVVRSRAQASYVAQKKVSEELVEMYFEAIQEYLLGRLDGGAKDLSLYESVARVLPGVGKGEYNKRHRARVEYLARQVEELALKRLRES